MNADSWIHQPLGVEKIREATEEAERRRLRIALSLEALDKVSDEQLRFIAHGLELRAFELLEEENGDALRAASLEAFQVARALPQASSPLEAAEELVRLGCLGILGDRGADVRRILLEKGLPALPLDARDWGTRVRAIILDIWLRLLRKQGWDDLDAVQRRIADLRREQRTFEDNFLAESEKRQDARPAWELMAEYHLAKAAEILGTYTSQGSVDGLYDIREQLEAQFDRAVSTSARGGLMEHEMLARLLARTSLTLIQNSIWTVTRAVNSRVTKFVGALTSRDQKQPFFEMLPPQRRTLREEGLLGSGHRSVVVSLPTSSGKTFIAEFRILQALNQFDQERGWVAYLAPTRALVNQLTLRLRRDFAPLGTIVEKVSPALEIDDLEAGILTDNDPDRQFKVLVTTPEKFDLMASRRLGRENRPTVDARGRR